MRADFAEQFSCYPVSLQFQIDQMQFLVVLVCALLCVQQGMSFMMTPYKARHGMPSLQMAAKKEVRLVYNISNCAVFIVFVHYYRLWAREIC